MFAAVLAARFRVKYPEISAGILDNKIEAIENANIDTVVSGDASCLMQIGGRLSRIGSKIKTMHLAEVLTRLSRIIIMRADDLRDIRSKCARIALQDVVLHRALCHLAETFRRYRKKRLHG